MQVEFKLYVSLLLAVPTRHRLGKELLGLMFESLQSAYDESFHASTVSHAKAMIVIFATASTVRIYESWGYIPITVLQDKANSSIAPCMYRYSPLGDVITHFDIKKCPQASQMANITAMLQFIPRRKATVNGESRLMDQFKLLNKSSQIDLVGGFVHIALTNTVKAQLSYDQVLKDHFKQAVYRLKTQIYTLGVVTKLEGDTYNVLVCIDNAAVKNNIDYLSKLVTGSHDKDGYMLRRMCSAVP